MKIYYFFRHPSPVFHSIEEQFFSMQKELPKDLEINNVFARYNSKGILKRIFITIQATFNQGDINHITGDINFIAILLNKRKTILTIHDIGSVLKGNKIKQTIKRFFWYYLPISHIKYLTVISEFSKQEVLQKLKIKESKIKVIPNCYSPLLSFNKKDNISDLPVLLQIGTKQNKNLPTVIEAIETIKCKLIIIGKLSNLQKSLLNKHKILYENHTNIAYKEVINLYIKSDIVLFVSTYEGFGVPIIEANAVGRPVITSNISPMKEVAANTALLVDPYDPAEITKSVKSLINNKDLRLSLIQKGRINAQKYNAKNIAEMYYNLYKTITS